MRADQRRVSPVQAGDRCNGESFWPLATGERTGGLRDTIITAFGWYASVRTREWNYQVAWKPVEGKQTRPPELYDLRNDPDELTNVIDQHRDVAARHQAYLDEYLRKHPVVTGRLAPTTTPAAIPGVDTK